MWTEFTDDGRMKVRFIQMLICQGPCCGNAGKPLRHCCCMLPLLRAGMEAEEVLHAQNQPGTQ